MKPPSSTPDPGNVPSRLAFALDVGARGEALAFCELLAPRVRTMKIGLELFTREGPALVREVRELGFDVFLDLKLHDIPETVGRAVASAGSLGARFLTVHAQGGRSMLARACEAAAKANITIAAVTVLTSLGGSELSELGVDAAPRDHALRLAEVAHAAGVRAFVCSPIEVAALRRALGQGAWLITPGVRAALGERPANDDQVRTADAETAIASGADMLVVGRPIRDAADPAAAVDMHIAAIERGLSKRAFHAS